MRHSSASAGFDPAVLGITQNLREKLHEVLAVLDSDQPVQAKTHGTTSVVTEGDVRAILRARRKRSEFFPEELFADPAWDILLELYSAELGQRRMSISSLCIGAAVPATTALRWISALEKKGLIKRHDDPFDGRRVYASLTHQGRNAMEAYFCIPAIPTAAAI